MPKPDSNDSDLVLIMVLIFLVPTNIQQFFPLVWQFCFIIAIARY